MSPIGLEKARMIGEGSKFLATQFLFLFLFLFRFVYNSRKLKRLPKNISGKEVKGFKENSL